MIEVLLILANLELRAGLAAQRLALNFFLRFMNFFCNELLGELLNLDFGFAFDFAFALTFAVMSYPLVNFYFSPQLSYESYPRGLRELFILNNSLAHPNPLPNLKDFSFSLNGRGDDHFHIMHFLNILAA